MSSDDIPLSEKYCSISKSVSHGLMFSLLENFAGAASSLVIWIDNSLFSKLFLSIFDSYRQNDDQAEIKNMYKYGSGEETFQEYIDNSTNEMVSRVTVLIWIIISISIIIILFKTLIEFTQF